MTTPPQADVQPASLLQTKLYTPSVRPELVDRPHLLERLTAGLRGGHKLALVSAPAGFGKTTLVSAWLQHLRTGDTGWSSTWLTLDGGDSVFARFATYLVAALQSVDAAIGASVQALLSAPQAPPVEPLITALINDIAVRPTPLVLVLDDYHTIAERTVHEAVRFLLARQPPQMHLVVITRHDPPFSLSRLRGRGQVTEIRQRDLRFSPQEAAAFLNRSMGLELAADEIATLDGRTEGWIAGLQMTALALQSLEPADSASQFIDTFSGRHHFILDYLTDEVLRRQPAPVQRFLLQTSVLERMCGSLCDALLGDGPDTGAAAVSGSSQSILEHLERANLFVVPLDGERRWYRYHRLFGELLRARLQETTPDCVPKLHRRAAAWYEQHALPADAIQHALSAADHSLAADVMERAIPRVAAMSSASVATFREWLTALPDDVMRTRPMLRLFLSRVLYLSGHREAAMRVLQELEHALGDDAPTAAHEYLSALVLADRASYAAVRGDVRQAVDLAHRALARLPDGQEGLRMRVAGILGLARLRGGEVSEARRAFARAISTATEMGIGFVAVPFVCSLAEIEIAQGRLRQAVRTCERALAVGTVDGLPTAATGFARLALAKILYEQNDLQAAEQHTREGLDLLVQGGTPDSFGMGRAVLAQILQARGDVEAARAAIQQVVTGVHEHGIPRLITLVSAYQARIWLAQDRLDMAARWADTYRQHAETEYLREFEDLTLARVLLAQGKRAEASSLLQALLQGAESAGRVGPVIEALALLGLAQAKGKDAQGGFAVLERSLALAEPEGYVRVYADAGAPMARLLLAFAASDAAHPRIPYVRRLIAAFDRAHAGPDAGPDAAPTPGERAPLVEPLSARETEVLVLLAQGLTNPEIARALFISLPTVKSHTRNIYGKLGVHSRKQAVVQARVLGLLPPAQAPSPQR